LSFAINTGWSQRLYKRQDEQSAKVHTQEPKPRAQEASRTQADKQQRQQQQQQQKRQVIALVIIMERLAPPDETGSHHKATTEPER
jgi:hypothetical protein